ncbi:MAG: threonine--tRNA ligase [Patescibacteria group bacterium]
MKKVNSKNIQIDIKRHSLAHVMALAVKELWPNVKFAIGPAIDNGFYYDFDFGNKKVVEDDLRKIEKKIKHLIKQDLKFEKTEINVSQAIEKEKKEGQLYKVDLLEKLKKEGEKKVNYYKLGRFEDLCRGPHIESAGKLNKDGFKLNKLAGAYWRGDEKNKMLTRIYGVAFETKQELEKYLEIIEEAEKRDHRKIGKELGLFVFSDLVGKGLPLFTPKGATIMRTLMRWIEDEEIRRGYIRTWTPDVTSVELYKISGHMQHYKDDMYPPMKIHGGEYIMRPMTCPHQFEIYNSQLRSYKDLPLRYAEISKLYRREKTGELSGLIRHGGGWSFADAHIICLPEQIEKEFESVVELIQYCMKTLKITEYWYRFSKWDPKNQKKKYIDDPKSWEATQISMKKILDKMKLDYIEAEDEAAFYGPKLDIQLRRVTGQEETAFTVQIDFALPERFGMTYIDKKGQEKRPMVIHRSSIGCLERTLAFVIEQCAGAFPVWLSPVQVKIISVGEKHIEYCKKLAQEFNEHEIRVEVDDHDETVGNKIRKAVHEKIPYILVIGDREMNSNQLSVRDRGKKETRNIEKEEFIKEIV